MTTRDHWNTVYTTKSPLAVSWFTPRLERSLALVERATRFAGAGQTDLDPASGHLVDIGGGASTLVDDLLALGYRHVSVADLSEHALEHSRQRLGDLADQVRWVVGDVTTRLFEDQSVDLWHDRAVFHFLTTTEERAAYLEHLANALRPGGFVILGTFGPNGPERCSGLPVVRYSAARLAEVLGPDFELVTDDSETHATPGGSSQAFTWTLFRRVRRTDEAASS